MERLRALPATYSGAPSRSRASSLFPSTSSGGAGVEFVTRPECAFDGREDTQCRIRGVPSDVAQWGAVSANSAGGAPDFFSRHNSWPWIEYQVNGSLLPGGREGGGGGVIPAGYSVSVSRKDDDVKNPWTWVVSGWCASEREWIQLDKREAVVFRRSCLRFAVRDNLARPCTRFRFEFAPPPHGIGGSNWELHVGNVHIFEHTGKPESLEADVRAFGASAALSDRDRLDAAIFAAARRGVSVRVILFREPALALPNNSSYAKRSLMRLGKQCGDIQVLRHTAWKAEFVGGVEEYNWPWSHHEKVVVVDQTLAFIGGIDLSFGRFDDPSHALLDPGSLVWRGKDFYNQRLKEFQRLDEPFDDSVSRERNARMPWHDIAMCVRGGAARDAAQHFINRWNRELIQLKSTPAARKSYAFLLPRKYESSVGSNASQSEYECSCQIVRSVGPWSFSGPVEHSIYDAYLRCIALARRFIYIENQFFVSGMGGVGVFNRIAEALFERIRRAVEAGARFRVIVVMPQWPGMEGEVERSSQIKLVLHHQYRTICRGKTSLLARLRKLRYPAGVSADDYIGFYCLRKAAGLNGRIVSEQVYVHSKVCLIDDRVAIIGSANINDRSMLGNRDSELAVVVDGDLSPGGGLGAGPNAISSMMDGKPWSVNPFCFELRCALFAEHLGMLPSAVTASCDDGESKYPFDVPARPSAHTLEIVKDPFSPLWDAVAERNTRTLEELCPRMPRNSYRRISDIPSRRDSSANGISFQGDAMSPARGTSSSSSSSSSASTSRLGKRRQSLLRSLQGNLVCLPLRFLENEDLQLSVGDSAFILPSIVFT